MKQTNFERWKETATAEGVASLVNFNDCYGCPCKEFCLTQPRKAFKGCKAMFIEWASAETKKETDK